MKIKKLTALLLAATMTIAMAVPAAADTYVASVEAKAAPTVGSVTGSDGTSYESSDLTVTPLSEADTTTTAGTSLTNAYADVKAATTLNDLVDLTSTLATINTANSTNYVAADLTVTDLFYISASGSIASALAAGNSVSVTLAVDGVSANDVVIVLQYADGTWSVLDSSDYVVNSDGTITVTIDKECTLAIVTPTDEAAAVGGTGTTSSTTTTETTSSSESTTTTDETTSPQTGETMNYGLIAMAAVLAFGAAVCFGTGKKRA